jgi:CO/xanthine dehydrogenase Mo-binding subunit
MNAAVEFRHDGRVQVRTGKVELGQGLHTALAQVVADALGVALDLVDVLPVDTAHSPDQGVTSGSLSLQDAGAALRAACAELRPVSGALRAVGRSVPAVDLMAKLSGAPAFIHDLTPPGLLHPLLHGRVLHPAPDATLQQVETAAAQALPGVLQVLHSGQLLGVVAQTSAQADAALAALAAGASWQQTAWPSEEAGDLQALPCTTRSVFEQLADTPVARQLQARYSKPWIAHASIAPSCALAQWTGDRLHVWSHSQGIFNLRRDLALAFAVDVDAVRVTHVPSAGCYGHNGADDVAFDAAWLARAVPGRAVRLLWSRADELTQSPQGPAMVVQLQAGLDAQGRIVQWTSDLWSPGHSRRPGRSPTPALLGAWQVNPPHAVPASIDMPLAVGGGAERNAIPGYGFDSMAVRCHSVRTQRRSSALRGLGALANVFAMESFIDEIAQATQACPLALRVAHLQHDPRAVAVLRAVAQRAGWATRHEGRADGVGHGIAYARYKNTGAWCAVVAQVQAGATLQVRHLTLAVDVGLAVNPGGVVNQIEGGAVQAASWALKEAAAAQHEGWADYPILRFTEVPEVDVLLLPSDQPSVGAGEAALGPTAAAIANALYDALSVRVRDLPLTPERIIAAMDSAP